MESVRRLRLAKGLTMKELASMVDVTESQISQIETGKRNPGFETLLKLGEALECSVEELIRNDKNPATESDGNTKDLSLKERHEYVNNLFDSVSSADQDYVISLLKRLSQSQRGQDGQIISD